MFKKWYCKSYNIWHKVLSISSITSMLFNRHDSAVSKQSKMITAKYFVYKRYAKIYVLKKLKKIVTPLRYIYFRDSRAYII